LKNLIFRCTNKETSQSDYQNLGRPGFQEAAAAEEAAWKEDLGGAGSPGRGRTLLLPLPVRGQGGQVQEALRVVGKLAVQPCINAVTAGSLFHIEDQLTHRRFLCDTGASYSILPHQSLAVASGPPLHGPAGRTSNTNGYSCLLTLTLQ
jgi:hypothetical protein